MSGPEQSKAGVWMVYTFNWHPIPVAVFANELDARRFADAFEVDPIERLQAQVRFWPFGEDWWSGLGDGS